MYGDKYVIRRNGKLYDTGYNSLTTARINCRTWCYEIGGLWQVFKLVKKGELKMYSIALDAEDCPKCHDVMDDSDKKG